MWLKHCAFMPEYNVKTRLGGASDAVSLFIFKVGCM